MEDDLIIIIFNPATNKLTFHKKHGILNFDEFSTEDQDRRASRLTTEGKLILIKWLVDSL